MEIYTSCWPLNHQLEKDDRDSGGQTLSATMANIEQLSAAGHVDWEVNCKSTCIH